MVSCRGSNRNISATGGPVEPGNRGIVQHGNHEAAADSNAAPCRRGICRHLPGQVALCPNGNVFIGPEGNGVVAQPGLGSGTGHTQGQNGCNGDATGRTGPGRNQAALYRIGFDVHGANSIRSQALDGNTVFYPSKGIYTGNGDGNAGSDSQGTSLALGRAVRLIFKGGIRCGTDVQSAGAKGQIRIVFHQCQGLGRAYQNGNGTAHTDGGIAIAGGRGNHRLDFRGVRRQFQAIGTDDGVPNHCGIAVLGHVHAHGCAYGNRRGTWGRL